MKNIIATQKFLISGKIQLEMLKIDLKKVLSKLTLNCQVKATARL